MDILYIDTTNSYSSQDKEIIKHSISNHISSYLPLDYYYLIEDTSSEFHYISNIYLNISMWICIKDNKFLQIIYPYSPNSFTEVCKESICYGTHNNYSLKSIWLEFLFSVSNKFGDINKYDSYNYFIIRYKDIENVEVVGGFKDIEYIEIGESYTLKNGCINRNTCVEWSIYQCNKRYVLVDIPVINYYILSRKGECINIGLVKEVFLTKYKMADLVYIAELTTKESSTE